MRIKTLYNKLKLYTLTFAILSINQCLYIFHHQYGLLLHQDDHSGFPQEIRQSLLLLFHQIKQILRGVVPCKLCSDNFGIRAIQVKVYAMQKGWGCVKFPGKKRYEGVRFNVISVTRGSVGINFTEKKRYETLHLNGPST